MSIEAYLQQVQMLNQGLTCDARTLLALTVGWLDPLTILGDVEHLGDDHMEEINDAYWRDDAVGQALYVTRSCFPDIHAQAISKIREGINLKDVCNFIDAQIENQTGLPVGDYEEEHAYAYGIPIQFYGFNIYDSEFYENHADEWEVIQMFGVEAPEDDEDSIFGVTLDEIPSQAWDIAYVLQWSLWDLRHSPLHTSLRWTIAYCFSNSGNSSVDFSYEEAIEWQPLQWTPHDVAFATDITREAQDIMAHVALGLEHLKDPTFVETVRKNIAIATEYVHKHQAKGKKIHDDTFISHESPNPFKIRWDDLCLSSSGETQPTTELLQLRSDAT
ncbi:MAG: hypothetical protein AAFR81_29800 [Chloroflexota bacterium]